MMLPEINYLGVLIGVVINMVLGFLWYGPLFGKPWMKLIGMTEKKMEDAKKKGMATTYLLSALGALLTAMVLSVTLEFTGAETFVQGMLIGFWMWLGFMLPVQLAQVLYEDKSINLLAINTGYYLVSVMLMGGVLAMM